MRTHASSTATPARSKTLWRRLARTAAAFSLLTAACRDVTVPTAPTATPPAISDASSGGSAGFYFLPPLVPKPSYAGTFDPNANPTVQVCNDASCASMHAVFTMTSGTGGEVVRVDLANQLYIVNWNAEKSGAVAGTTYRVRVIVGGAVAGFTDVLFKGKGVNATNLASNETVVMVNGNTLPIKFRLETGRTVQPTQPATCRSCLEVLPGAVLLTGSGAQKQLVAYNVDAQGNRTPTSATFTSSQTANVSVTSNGLATAVANVGSSQIVAQANGRTSAPVLVTVATPVAGALLITDEQINGSPVAVDPTAPAKPGWRYRVSLKGVTPAVGQVVLNTGFIPVGGKTISATPNGALVDVILELLPIAGMFTALEVNQQISLANLPLALPSNVQQSFTAQRQRSGGLRLTMNPGTTFVPRNVLPLPDNGRGLTAVDAKVEFDLGVFKCEAEGTGGLAFPISLSTATLELNPNLTLDLQFSGLSFKRAVVTGSLAPLIEFEPQLTAAVAGKLECKFKISTIVPPIGGPLAFFGGVQIPYGVGFGLEAQGNVGGMSFDAYSQANVSASFGADCTSACTLVENMSGSSNGYFKPSVPSVDSLRTEFSASGFGWAELHVGATLIPELQFNLVEVKAALQTKLELAGMTGQAGDAGYASSFATDFVLEAGNSAELEQAAGLLSISLPELKLEQEYPLAHSPTGTLTITPDVAEPGNGVSLGDQVTFKVTLNQSTYMGIEAVDGVEIRWLKTDSNGNQTLDFSRPGCTSLAASPGQTVFTCTTDFLEQDQGVQTFYAFIRAKLFGVPVPIPIEISDDSKATLNVTKFGHVHRSIQYDNGNTSETDLVVDHPETPAFSGTGLVTYHSTGSFFSGTPPCPFDIIFHGTATSWTIVPTGQPNQWSVNATVSGDRTIINQCSGNVVSVTPFTQAIGIASGVSIFNNGVLIGIDFDSNVRFGGTSPGLLTATGKLKVK